MAQSEMNKQQQVAKTVETNDDEEEFGPQLIGRLEVISFLFLN